MRSKIEGLLAEKVFYALHLKDKNSIDYTYQQYVDYVEKFVGDRKDIKEWSKIQSEYAKWKINNEDYFVE